jgi:subfamily B ATP-binding cassette protein MsbA
VTASLSAAIAAVLAGMIVWMAGPLLMTLFQVESVVGVEVGDVAPASGLDVSQIADSTAAGEIVQRVSGSVERLREGMKGAVDGLVQAETRKDTLIRFCWLIMFVVIGKNFFTYLQGFFMAFVQQSVVRTLRDHIFGKYQRLSLNYFHSRRTGQVISRVTNDVVVLNESIDLSFNHLVTDSIMVILFSCFLIILSWKLTLLAAVVMPLVFVFIWFIGRKLRKYSERSQERMADVNSVLEENVNNIRIVKAFAREKFETKKFAQTTSEYFRALLRMTRIRHLASPTNDTLISFAGVAILLYAGSRIIAGSGELDAGDFMTFIIAMFSLMKPVKSLSQIHIRIQEGMAAAERIFGVLNAKEDITEPANPTPLTEFNQAIEYKNVNFAYDGSVQVLSDISFQVPVGKVLAIVGPSGAGKSTILDLLPRFYDPQQGAVTIDGQDIRTASLTDLRGLMGIVTQETLLFNETVTYNIAYGMDDCPQERVIEAARTANADQFISEFENGYETIVGNRGVRLSGGQRQRLAIARALLRDPRILIFDEATSALDTESELLVQEAISRLMHDRTTLVVAHRLSTIVNAHSIIVIDGGRIVEEGNHEDLLAKGGLYRRLYDLQFKNGSDSDTKRTDPEGRE